jgi:hypothetical protein
LPVLIGKNFKPEPAVGMIEREKRRYYDNSLKFAMRMARNVIDLYRASSITLSDLISVSRPHVVKYKPILSIAYVISKILGHYKNLEPNNPVGLVKKQLYTLTDPVVYSINKNFYRYRFF